MSALEALAAERSAAPARAAQRLTTPLPVDGRVGEVARALLAGHPAAADQLVGVT
jgi:hypothetical protein